MNEALTPKTESVLREAGWYPGRDVSDQFLFSPRKKMFPEAFEVCKEFGYLFIDQKDYEQVKIMFDIDNSETSKKLRRFHSRLPETGTLTQQQIYDSIPFWGETPNFLRTATTADMELERFLDDRLIEQCMAMPCAYIGHLVMNIPGQDFDSALHITETGHIYGEFRFPMFKGIYELLNTLIDEKYQKMATP